MVRKILLLLFSLSFTVVLAANPPKREFRGAWIATVANLDWPSAPGLNPQVQREELQQLFDNLQSYGINSVIFQIRPECDALYASPFEPWSYYLTGRQGTAPAPFYDPLAFAVQEAHVRGMELHAWFNPYRAVRQIGANALANQHVSVQHPEWVITIGSFKFLNPGLPQVREYVCRVVMDVVRRYNIDGIHFDDYFYPYPPGNITTEDQNTFQVYGGSFSDIKSWRRDNVNTLIRMLHDSLQISKPEVKFGISPFGIWKSGVPEGIVGLSSYDEIYCDAVTWLQNQWIDYITPQLYWKIGGGQDYSRLMPWWSSMRNGRHLYTGNAAYRITTWSSSEMPNQIRLNRSNDLAQGVVFFRALNLRANPLGFSDSLQNDLYRFPALSPVMAWKDAMAPNPPEQLLYACKNEEAMQLRWNVPTPAADGDTAARYAVYRFAQSPLSENDLQESRNLLTVTGRRQFDPPMPEDRGPYYFIVTSLDDNSNESAMSSVLMLQAPQTPVLAWPVNRDFDLADQVTLTWHSVAKTSRYRLQVSLDSTLSSGLFINELTTDTMRVIEHVPGQQTYYWRVQSGNGGGRSGFSDIWAFRSNRPVTPVPVAPVDYATKVSVAPVLTWRPAAGALIYQLQLNRSLSFTLSSMVLDTTITADTTCTILLRAQQGYFWRVRSINNSGESDWSVTRRFKTGDATEVADGSLPPLQYRLFQNYPNPFNAVTCIPFELPAPSHVRLEVFDMLGRSVRVLVDQPLMAGSYKYDFNASQDASGVYIYRLSLDQVNLFKRMLLLR